MMKHLPKIFMVAGGGLLLLSIVMLALHQPITNENDIPATVSLVAMLLFMVPLGITLFFVGFTLWFRNVLRRKFKK